MRPVAPWNQYFMRIAEAVATRSKDPFTQVGAVIADKYHRILSTGYNGFPPGVEETPEMWERPFKYQLVIHAEANAILHAKKDLTGSTLYVTLSPCAECVKLCAGAGVKRVVYKEDRVTPEVLKVAIYLNVTLEKYHE